MTTETLAPPRSLQGSESHFRQDIKKNGERFSALCQEGSLVRYIDPSEPLRPEEVQIGAWTLLERLGTDDRERERCHPFACRISEVVSDKHGIPRAIRVRYARYVGEELTELSKLQIKFLGLEENGYYRLDENPRDVDIRKWRPTTLQVLPTNKPALSEARIAATPQGSALSGARDESAPRHMLERLTKGDKKVLVGLMGLSMAVGSSAMEAVTAAASTQPDTSITAQQLQTILTTDNQNSSSQFGNANPSGNGADSSYSVSQVVPKELTDLGILDPLPLSTDQPGFILDHSQFPGEPNLGDMDPKPPLPPPASTTPQTTSSIEHSPPAANATPTPPPPPTEVIRLGSDPQHETTFWGLSQEYNEPVAQLEHDNPGRPARGLHKEDPINVWTSAVQNYDATHSAPPPPPPPAPIEQTASVAKTGPYDINNSSLLGNTSYTAAQLKSAAAAMNSHNGFTDAAFQAFVDAGKKHNMDSLYIMGHAAEESAWGNSKLAQDRNNLFGFNAYDRNPDGASSYNSQVDSINFFANFMKNVYLTPPNGQWFIAPTPNNPGIKIGQYYNGATLHDVFVKYSSSHDREANIIAGIMNNFYTHINGNSAAGNGPPPSQPVPPPPPPPPAPVQGDQKLVTAATDVMTAINTCGNTTGSSNGCILNKLIDEGYGAQSSLIAKDLPATENFGRIVIQCAGFFGLAEDAAHGGLNESFGSAAAIAKPGTFSTKDGKTYVRVTTGPPQPGDVMIDPNLANGTGHVGIVKSLVSPTQSVFVEANFGVSGSVTSNQTHPDGPYIDYRITN